MPAKYILRYLLGAYYHHHPLVRLYVTTCNAEEVLEASVPRKLSVEFIEGSTLQRDVRTQVFP
jgi:hypothetical protein